LIDLLILIVSCVPVAHYLFQKLRVMLIHVFQGSALLSHRAQISRRFAVQRILFFRFFLRESLFKIVGRTLDAVFNIVIRLFCSMFLFLFFNRFPLVFMILPHVFVDELIASMLLFDMGVKSWITEIRFSTVTVMFSPFAIPLPPPALLFLGLA
jgi:hypothetical protein